MKSIPLLTVCPNCGRPAHLWGGPSCDVCDRDSNGTNDRDEPVGSGAVVVLSVFESRQTGWEMVGQTKRRVALPLNFSLLSDERQLHVLQVLKDRFKDAR